MKSGPKVAQEYPSTESAGMDTIMRHTIAGHFAGEYRRAMCGVAAGVDDRKLSGVDDLRWSRNRRDDSGSEK